MPKLFSDSKRLTEEQQQKLCRMMFEAFIELRLLGWQGKAEQAADLADAFHNLPAFLWSEDFSFCIFREFLEAYHRKYPERGGFDYLAMLDEIE
jgi:aminoglycoside phosphotransferase